MWIIYLETKKKKLWNADEQQRKRSILVESSNMYKDIVIVMIQILSLLKYKMAKKMSILSEQ